jgi:hypothetical protein
MPERTFVVRGALHYIGGTPRATKPIVKRGRLVNACVRAIELLFGRVRKREHALAPGGT